MRKPDDETYLRRAIALAIAARSAGRHPFGSLVVHDGAVIAEAEARMPHRGFQTSEEPVR
jgi:tRNA(Arg) A34 adenosine deaminase TadA